MTTLMKKAVRKGDATNTLIQIDKWLIEHKADIPRCPICNNDLRVVGALSQNVVTHFAHFEGANCPTTAKANKSYLIFKDTERVGAVESRRIKEYAVAHLESIYERAQALCPSLSWKEFLPLLEKATELNVWTFKGFDPLYIPYLLLCCADSFSGIRGGKRPHTLFFVLEPGASDAEFWHQPGSVKQRIWRIDSVSGDVDDIVMKLKEIQPWYRLRAKAALGLLM